MVHMRVSNSGKTLVVWALVLVLLVVLLIDQIRRDFAGIASMVLTDNKLDQRGVYPYMRFRNPSGRNLKVHMVCTVGVDPNRDVTLDLESDILPKGGIGRQFISHGEVHRGPGYHSTQYCHLIAVSYFGLKQYTTRVQWNLESPAITSSMLHTPVFFGRTIPR
jgi:hypothetical protein